MRMNRLGVLENANANESYESVWSDITSTLFK